MCSNTLGRVLDPAKLLTGNSAKWADPLGLTRTAIGDPTGQLRRNAANEAKKGSVTPPSFLNQNRQATVQGAPRQTKTVLGG